MTLFSSFFDLFTRRKDASYIYDLDLIQDVSNRAYLKKLAIDTCIDYVARAVSASEFRVMSGTKSEKNDIYYKLNVRPNTDYLATNFWQEVINKLIRDNEVLVIVNDSHDLLIADNFIRNESANYPDTFTDVTVKNYTFQRTFNMSDVWYMQYNNAKLDDYINGLWSDYGELFGRILETNMRNNQIRATVAVNATTGTASDTQEKLQKFIDNTYKSFNHNSIAIVPITNGFEYNEVSSSKVNTNQSVSELNDLRLGFLNDVARLIGIPPALVTGEKVESKENLEAFYNSCLKPLLNKIRDELNAKLFSPFEYLHGKHIDVIGINRPDPFALSDSIDKLISSGTFSRNEIRQKLGEEPVKGLDEFVITKNYTTSTKGGDKDDNSN